MELQPSDLIVTYTDGVTDATNHRKDFYDDHRLVAFLGQHRGSASAVVDGLLNEVMQFQMQRPRDDIALIAVAVPGDGNQAVPNGEARSRASSSGSESASTRS
jgi:sigma-B regulation protein RsbU (phosphoserine phosphatase)